MTTRVGPARVVGALAAAAVFAAPNGPLAAQQAAGARPGQGQSAPVSMAEPRVPLGVTVGTSGGNRDTLGLLVVAVVAQSPADRAGVVEGSRIASVNGVRLRLTPAEVGQAAPGDALVRRFDQEIQGTRPGEPIVLEVVGGGRRQTISVPLGGGPPAVLSSAPLVPAPASAPPVAAPPVAAQPAPPAAPPAAPATVPNATAGGVLGDAAPAVAGAAAAAPGIVAPAVAAPGAVVTAGAPSVAPAVAPAATPALTDARLPAIDSAHAATLGAVIERMGELQQQLHRLARDQRSLALADTLSDAEEDLAALRRRLRTAAAVAQARTDSARDAGLPGLRLAPVNDDLAAYFGDGSARGLLVVQADAAWDPIRAGDVVLRVDGAPADAERLRAAFNPGRRSTIELLRRRRVLTVTLHGRAGA